MLWPVARLCPNYHEQLVSLGIIINSARSRIMLDRPVFSAKDRVLGLVNEILERRSIHQPISADADLRDVGLASMDMVSLMLAVEAEFDLTISDGDMTIENFRSIAAIDKLVASLHPQG
jgi:acyl carrier protein